jgi:glutaminyl-tRNA synthetase
LIEKKEVYYFGRVMAVTEPLKVTITNFPNENFIELTVPNFPADESRGSHTIKFDSIIYIEKSDFTEVNSINMFR